eukprot:358456-Chlamydomonas_euryale.AAC.4
MSVQNGRGGVGTAAAVVTQRLADHTLPFAEHPPPPQREHMGALRMKHAPWMSRVASPPSSTMMFGPSEPGQGLALPGEHRARVARDGGGSVVLGGENVARAPAHFRAQSRESLNQHRSLDSHVQGAHDASTLQRLALAELGAACHESRALGLGHLNLQATEVCLGDVLDLVLRAWQRNGVAAVRNPKDDLETVWKRIASIGIIVMQCNETE